MSWPLALLCAFIAAAVPIVHSNATDRGRLMTFAALLAEVIIGLVALFLVLR